MEGWMDEWMNKGMHRQIHVAGWTDGCMDRQIEGYINVLCIQRAKWMDGWRDTQIECWMDKWIDE